MAYNGSTTIGEIRSFVAKAMSENDIFRIGKNGVAKAFLQYLLGLSSDIGFKEVEEHYRKRSSGEDIPENSEDFWKFIGLEYLELDLEPRETFATLSLQVVEDLGKIAENLKYISSERKLLEEKKRKNGRLAADERYYRNQLDYFEKKNTAARDEIVSFMTNDIRSHAIIESMTKRSNLLSGALGLIFNDKPYSFGRGLAWSIRNPYDVRSLDEYSNKFADLHLPHYKEIIKACRASPEDFKEYASGYIAGIPDKFPSVREKIEKLVERSHILARRKQVILTMLNHFESKDYISFVSIAPLQVEGIFADICREVGVSEVQLDISSLNDKLQHIDERLDSFFFFEYYSFKFPVLRNLVAHGGLVDGELEGTAIHLMLDLLPVCDLAVSKDLPINRALSVLDEAITQNYKKLIEWLYLRDSIDIPDFYDAKDKISAANRLYESSGFWEYLEGELKRLRSVSEIKESRPFKAAGMLKRSNLATEKAEKFLKSACEIVRKAIQEREEFVEKFTRRLGLPDKN